MAGFGLVIGIGLEQNGHSFLSPRVIAAAGCWALHFLAWFVNCCLVCYHFVADCTFLLPVSTELLHSCKVVFEASYVLASWTSSWFLCSVLLVPFEIVLACLFKQSPSETNNGLSSFPLLICCFLRWPAEQCSFGERVLVLVC